MILTYDRTLINVSKNIQSFAWVNTSFTFLDLTEMAKDMTEKKLSALVHSMAAFSNKTLSIGARILDRIILYASDKMQEWEFQEDIKKLKQEIINSISSDDTNFMCEVDRKTNDFLARHGIAVNLNDEQNDVDLESELEQ